MDKDKIIKIKGNKDEWYKEAIFIIRADTLKDCSYKDIQTKADMIIGNYAKRNGLHSQPKEEEKQDNRDRALNLILISSISILLILLYLL